MRVSGALGVVRTPPRNVIVGTLCVRFAVEAEAAVTTGGRKGAEVERTFALA